MRKKVRQKFIAQVHVQVQLRLADATISEATDSADIVIVRPSARPGLFLIAAVTCRDSQDAVFVHVGWNGKPELDPFASDTGARFDAEVGKPAATLALSAVVDMDMPLYLDPGLALWHRRQIEWYEALESGRRALEAPPAPPPAAAAAELLGNVDFTATALVEGVERTFDRIDRCLE